MISIPNLLFQVVLLLSLPINTSVAAFPIAKPGCTPSCGNVSIPFPFGIEEDCYLEDDFAIDCNSDKPFLRNLNLEVLNISLDGTLRVNHGVLYTCNKPDSDKPYVNLENTTFYYSQTGNRFTALGCNNLAFMSSNETVFGGCFSTCVGESSYKKGSIKINISERDGCYGINCCQAKIPSHLQTLNVSVMMINDEGILGTEEQGCKSAFLVDQSWFVPNFTNHKSSQNLAQVPVVLDWVIFNFSSLTATNKSSIYRDSYICSALSRNLYPFVYCNCMKGYEGNPYLLQGCQDIDECKSNVCGSDVCINVDGKYHCYPHPPTKLSKINLVMIVLGPSFGSLFLLVGAWWLSIIIKKRKEKKLKEKYFKQNGGLLLERQLTSSDGSVDRSKLFNSKDLDKATDHFNVDRKIGEGGQGTVYKGMLANGRIVAVKKSKLVDDIGKLQEFVNEVIILSEIKHRNIVELLGYCLETQVPLLVYEFIPNGTLFDYLHDPKEELLSLTWDMRLRIATEVADALSYLHSAASMAIYHRDIKSANILLDNKYRAKVADFGISKCIEIDQTHATTKVVKGTIGYMDPEYFQSRQFTNKSDVYSFGVVLIELLTEQKPISSKGGSLVQKFIELMKENHLFDILSSQVKSEGKDEEIMAVANLTYRCVNLKGSKRPTMKEVSVELQRIRASENNNLHQNYEEVENMRSEVLITWDGPSISTGSTFEITVPSTDFQPLLNA